MRVAGYVRVSTTEQAKNGYSVEEQENKIRQYCDLKGYELMQIYSDPGYTGTNYDRPALQRLLNEYKAYDMVLVFRLDRLSRTQEGALHLVDAFQSNGVAFTSISEQFDTSTPIGKAMLGIAAAFAELDHDTILERMALGREGRARKGLWRGGANCPLGYTFKDDQLVINDDAVQIREVFERFLSGESMRGILRAMHDKYGGWNQPSAVSRCLRNPVYKGIIEFNGEYFQGQHKPIIDPIDWDRAQALYQSRMDHVSATQRNPYKASHLLVGLLYCAECGRRYGVIQSVKNGVRYAYYRCDGKSYGCTSKNQKLADLDAIVIGEIEKLDYDEPAKQKAVDHSREIAKIERQISKLIDLYTVDGISQKELTNRIETLNKRKDKLRIVPEVKRDRPPREKVHAILHTGSFKDRKALVDALIDKIEIDGDDMHIYWNL